MEQTPSANVAPNGRCRTVRRLAIGAASKVFQPAALAGQEAAADQEVRTGSDFADVIPLGGDPVRAASSTRSAPERVRAPGLRAGPV